MKVVITGGHLTPALAVIDAMPKNWEVLYVGRKHGLEGDRAVTLEYETIRKMGISFFSITAGRWQRKFTAFTVWSLLKIPVGFIQAFYILFTNKPAVVLSFGGYISLPVCVSAYVLNIPVVIHEQTLGVGIANRIVSFFAKKICISWTESKEFFPKSKTVLTGNPIRKSQIPNPKSQIPNEKIPLIYITGGSTGSHAINVLIEGCIKKLLEHYKVIHQTGDARKFGDFQRLSDMRMSFPEKLQKRYVLAKFIPPEDILYVFKAADIIISRAGMNTITELLYCSKPALLIPLRYGQQNEQYKNAQFFSKLGLGKILNQDDLTSDLLYEEIVQFVKQKDIYNSQSNIARTLRKENSAEEIINVVASVV